MAEVYEPPLSEWGAVLAASLSKRPHLLASLGPHRVAAVRKEVIDLAVKHSEGLASVAAGCGAGNSAPASNYMGDENAVLMAGHQPVVYHPGLLCKVEALAQSVSSAGATGINVVIDTDDGDGGALAWPRVANGAIEIKKASIATASESGGLYCGQRIANASVVGEIFSAMAQDLEQSGLVISAEQSRRAGVIYRQLAGESIVVAHAVVRWLLTGMRVLEAPLSAIVQGEHVRAIMQELARDGENMASVYNTTLDEYRREHRIHNQANPFPNMRREDNKVEVPLWRVKNYKRSPVYIEASAVNRFACDPGEFLAPRGSITTMLLRAFCSDLFIHGMGGARYDRFVDRLAKVYLNVELPRFVLASRTAYLFPDKVAELSRSLELIAKVKEISSKTELFLGQSIFSADEELELRRLTEARFELRDMLQKASSAEEKSRAAHALNALNKRVREAVETGSLRQHIENAPQNEAALARWSFREFPFFLYKLPRAA